MAWTFRANFDTRATFNYCTSIDCTFARIARVPQPHRMDGFLVLSFHVPTAVLTAAVTAVICCSIVGRKPAAPPAVTAAAVQAMLPSTASSVDSSWRPLISCVRGMLGEHSTHPVRGMLGKDVTQPVPGPAPTASLADRVDRMLSLPAGEPVSEEMLLPVRTAVCAVTLERIAPERLAFRVVTCTPTGGGYSDDDDLPRCLELVGRALRLNEPLLGLYDLRCGRVPPLRLSWKLVTYVTRWADAHARLSDTHFQGFAIVITSPVARGFINMVSKLVAAPQPTAFVADVEEGLRFLATIRVVRSYLKEAR